MKRLFCTIIILLAVFTLASCQIESPEVYVNEDGFVVVNGAVTDISARQEDAISVDGDGYVVVNGVKTEHKVSAGEKECTHSYTLFDSVESTCVDAGYDLYMCGECGGLKLDEKEKLTVHKLDEDSSCQERSCVVEGCDYAEVINKAHVFNDEYVCEACSHKKECSLEIIGEDFSEDLINRAKINAGEMTGDFEVVVLEREDTLKNIEMYVFSTNVDMEKVTRGLFVKFDVTYGGPDVLFTIYYNFGLEFSEDVAEDLAVTYEGSGEIWFLEVVEGNQKLLFEYSITRP